MTVATVVARETRVVHAYALNETFAPLTGG